MLRWLPSVEGLDTLDIEAAHSREAARLARLAPVHPGPLARMADAIRARVEDRHALTEYPCRLPDGRLGLTAIRRVDGEWTAVCVLPSSAGGASAAARLRPEATWASTGS
jgi:hypothetical protein